MKTVTAQSEAWTRYWAGGMTESCFMGQTPVAFPSTWLEFARSLGPGERVIDLACGAGTVARQIQASSPSLRIDGVDFANSLPRLQGIQLHPNTNLESLPFEAATFDAVVSQFGFEYADVVQASAEAARVLKPSGHLCLIIHNSSGPAIADAKRRVQRLMEVNANDGILIAMRNLALAHKDGVDASATEMSAKAAWQRLHNAREQDETTSWALSFSRELLENWKRFEPGYLVDNTGKLSAEIALYAARIEAMVLAAQDQSGMDTIADLFREAGIEISTLSALHYQSDPVAWHLGGHKTSLAA
jgi:ubiquinone/menaquinone biosynthesis C-methylase UbiE